MATTLLQQYLDSIQGKRVAVIGIGVSNTPLIKTLLGAGISVTACDKTPREKFGPLAQELEELGAELHLGDTYLDGLDQDIIFRSPGIRPDIPPFLVAMEKGSVLTSEMEVFFQVCPCKIIAVTGSDGKTTTTTLISEMLKNAGYTVHLGGNIGKPLLSEAGDMKETDVAVLELSSFQLMTLSQSPDIAVFTNLSPNHLDIHKSMEEYAQAKENIFCHQAKEGLAIFNQDNDLTLEMSARAPGRVMMFSRRQPVEQGVYVEDGTIVVANHGEHRRLFETNRILIPGQHNVENYLAAIAAVQGLVTDEVILHTAETFPGVEHRIELVRTLNGVRYYNDSIASSPTRTVAGLRSFHQKVILIAGGYDKKIPFDLLGQEVPGHVKTLVLTGATAEKIQQAVMAGPDYREGHPVILRKDDFQEAVLAARDAAEEGDVVILSPACASFDHFKNFAQRGERFKEIVRSL
ncbi:MAG: UDP-N-acetylmuramoyl-L-alanine--D-glutamate ligase [Evtepia sp.]|uniref:UDP-N-acetylmuramoyl-L-alanine--D-glutamate ligase n=1 Tax=Evtepia sp. TaxID=2773933 RepID=UPI002A748559|nr:UDP-N-acetylmuramoyl-L-alanine--D-glutamate ligase [Evtepia sp.]MDY3014018.1 UDP-N-acetylmuramoyl-L-alanine--D-glutamate ligase [Evtepia sp.]